MKKLILFFLALLTLSSSAFATEKNKESAYDRVMRTKTLRCGYLPYEPYIIKDPNTGKLSGVTVDYINAIAERQGIKVDWAGEVNIDQVVPALNGRRFDAFCLPCTPDLNWEKNLGFAGSLGAISYFVYVPEKSALTKEQLETAKFTTVDGYAMTDVTKNVFPDAQYVSLPQTTPMAEMYDQLRYKKADAIVNDHISATNYMKNNQGVIRRFSNEPVIAMKMFFVVGKDDTQMQGFINDTFDADASNNTALMKELVQKYKVPEGSLLLGDQCKKSVRTDKGWRICED